MSNLKNDFRSRLANWRSNLTESEWASRSQQVRTQLKSLPELKNVRRIHAFWPIETFREIDLRPLIRNWLDEDVEIWLPLIQNDLLVIGQLTDEKLLVSGKFGVQEPPRISSSPPSSFDCILVPGLTFDQTGHRIGYGKGYYDRFLGKVNGLKIAPTFREQLLPSIPSESHDVKMDIVVTENSIMRT